MSSYAGIGSRQTPKQFIDKFIEIGEFLALKGITLRSGGADGADQAFEMGSDKVTDKAYEWHPEFGKRYNKEIYIPWDGFNDYWNNPDEGIYATPTFINYQEARIIAEECHPYWYNLSEGSRKLHTRNVYQILGENLDDPVDLVLCWTPDGKEIGGTSQALRIARAYEIPIINAGEFTVDMFDKLVRNSNFE